MDKKRKTKVSLLWQTKTSIFSNEKGDGTDLEGEALLFVFLGFGQQLSEESPSLKGVEVVLASIYIEFRGTYVEMFSRYMQTIHIKYMQPVSYLWTLRLFPVL